jgi:inorganic pyrophosphatase
MNNNTKYLNQIVTVKIDRPLGSKHPKHGFIYPVNYGYIPNTISGDGEELDAYVLGIYEPIEEFTGVCIAIIHRTNDDDDKLIIVPENKDFTDSEIRALTNFQEQYFESVIIRPTEYISWNKLIPELSITNLENSLRFYKTAGFTVNYTRTEDKFAFISISKIQFMLQEISKDDKWQIAPLTFPFGNGINFQLEVNNLEKIYNNFKSANYKITFDIEENWYRKDDKLLGNKEFLIQDPDGYLLRFSEDLGEKDAFTHN